jgi:hypothetical protein
MSQIPDLIKIGSVPSDMEVDVDTDILDPVIVNNGFCRFTLLKKGFMNSFSKITLGLNTFATETENTLPLNVGIGALIERATLKVGAVTVSQTEDFGHFYGYKSMFIDQSTMKEREQVLTSRLNCLRLLYSNDPNTPYNASNYGLDNGLEYNADDYVGLTEGLNPHEFQKLGNTPVFQISLADLFPFLRYNSLPLYMFEEQISIELVFNTNNSQRQVGVVEASTINTGEVKLIADYIFYDGQTMSDFAEANKSMNFQYVDYQLNKRSLTQAQAQSKQIINVGGAGRVVSKLFSALGDDATANGELVNVYRAEAPLPDADGNDGELISNLRYNNKFLYPVDRSSTAIHFHDVVSTEANPLQVSRQMYANTGGTLTTEKYAGLDQDDLAGVFFYQADRLNRNERINSRGIELELKFSSVNNSTHTHRTWIEVIKQATLRDGMLDINFA